MGKKIAYEQVEGKIKDLIASAPDPQVAEIIEGHLFLGSQDAALNLQELEAKNVKFILNVAFGVSNAFPNLFTYKNVEILDVEESDVSFHFEDCFQFINLAKKENKGVLVHCNAGISRSSTIVIAYIMKHLSLPFQEAHQMVKAKRERIKPNPGFVRQLELYEKVLNK